MSRSRTSSLWLVLWGALVFQGLSPVPAVEAVLEQALAPLRFAAELAAPLGWFRARSVAAAERALARDALAEAGAGVEALTRIAARALPRDPELLRDRDFVAGEVVERPSKDECWVVVRGASGIEPGRPVVCGDAFVGRVLEVGPLGGPEVRVRVQLLTAGPFRVGAEVRGGAQDERVYLTAGGVEVPRSRGEPRAVRIAAHQPSASALAGGLARVHELFADAGAAAELAEGFRLGVVHRAGERDPPWIEPELDYLDGLFQVAIVVPAGKADHASNRIASPLQDGQWLGTRALTHGDPASWRSTVKLPLGRAAGIEPGAAVTGPGARLVGRVIHVGSATSDVALLADPGFTFTAIAVAEGETEPRILGRMSTLGRGADGAIRLRWWVRVPFDGASDGRSELVARVFTGSGEPGLPAGLFVGTVRLPASVRAGDEREVVLQTDLDPAAVRTLFARRASAPPAP